MEPGDFVKQDLFVGGGHIGKLRDDLGGCQTMLVLKVRTPAVLTSALSLNVTSAIRSSMLISVRSCTVMNSEL